MIITGFVPWEPLLSIQIVNSVLSWMTSCSIGLIGVIGLSLTLVIYVKRNDHRFSFLSIVLLSSIAVISSFMLILFFALPTFEWKDTDVYRNGNDYLVIQEQETFVTSNQTYPRLIRTTSPYGIIRRVEEQYYLKPTDDSFGGSEVLYKGRTWIKESLKEEE